jgi:UDP-glucose 4-epimerase
MKVLVTGGAGYIGSHVVNLLGQASHEIIILDNLSTGRKASILFGKLVVGDLADTKFVSDLLKNEKFDICIHFAGSIIVPESVTNPFKYYENNTVNSLSLIKLCVEHKVNRFIFSSTAAVYGLAEGGKCDEATLVNPINPYGRSKLMTEWTLQDAAIAHGLNFIALRYFNVAGANIENKIGQCSPFSTHLIKIACEVATGIRDKMQIFGTDYQTTDGTCIRDYIHVDDLAMAHVDALNYLAKEKESHILNCGYGQGATVKQVIEMMRKVSGKTILAEEAGRRGGDSPELIAIATKIKSILGWKPKYNNLELITKTALDWETKFQTLK